jgi:hypothetical protein
MKGESRCDFHMLALYMINYCYLAGCDLAPAAAHGDGSG